MEFKNFPYPKDKGIKLIKGLKISRPMFLFTSPAHLNRLWRVFKLDYNWRLVLFTLVISSCFLIPLKPI